MKLQVTSLETEWRNTLAQIGGFDFVHTYDFFRISQSNGEGDPLLFIALGSNGRVLGCWPTLKRSIPGTSYFDLSSAYGYGGPLFSGDVNISCVFEFLVQGMKNNGAISLFSRMHPLFDAYGRALNDEMQLLGDVVIVPVSLSGCHMADYRGSHRREIVSAKKRGLELEVDWGCKYLDEFLRLYHSTMHQVCASDFYFFGDRYFSELASASDFKVFIVFAVFDGVRISAGMFICANNIMHYFLSGSDRAYRGLYASKAVISRAHEMAVDLGIDFLVLGGGVGSSRDSLFSFKAGFSKTFKPFCVFKKVLDSDIYRDLCESKMVSPGVAGFFPAYRCS